MKKRTWIVTGGLLLFSAGLIVAGICRGEHAIVMEKAIRICLECIGIG